MIFIQYYYQCSILRGKRNCNKTIIPSGKDNHLIAFLYYYCPLSPIGILTTYRFGMLVLFVFFNVGPPKKSIFLTNIYDLYFSHHFIFRQSLLFSLVTTNIFQLISCKYEIKECFTTVKQVFNFSGDLSLLTLYLRGTPSLVLAVYTSTTIYIQIFTNYISFISVATFHVLHQHLSLCWFYS